MADAMEQVKQTMNLVNTKRKVNSITQSLSGWFVKPDYNEYTDLEAHAVSHVTN